MWRSSIMKCLDFMSFRGARRVVQVRGQVFKLRFSNQERPVSTEILQGLVLPMPVLAESAISPDRDCGRDERESNPRVETAWRESRCAGERSHRKHEIHVLFYLYITSRNQIIYVYSSCMTVSLFRADCSNAADSHGAERARLLLWRGTHRRIL